MYKFQTRSAEVDDVRWNLGRERDVGTQCWPPISPFLYITEILWRTANTILFPPIPFSLEPINQTFDSPEYLLLPWSTWCHVAGPYWLHLSAPFWAASPTPPCSTWLSCSSLTGMHPSPLSFLSTFTLAFIWYGTWKNALSWCRWLMITRYPGGRKTLRSHHCGRASHLVAGSIFSLAPSSPWYPFWWHIECSCECPWMLVHRTMPVSCQHKLPDCTLWGFLLHVLVSKVLLSWEDIIQYLWVPTDIHNVSF